MIRLHGYWRSSASYRVRIALALKGLAFDQVTHDLRRGEQRDPAYADLNPQLLVPFLEAHGHGVSQSLAILEALEERHPEPPLLPSGWEGRATVRSMAAIVACDVSPLNNLRVLASLRTDLGADEIKVSAWMTRWVHNGFTALERLVTRHGDRFAFGATPTFADCCLVPQFYNCERFGIDVSPFPSLAAAVSVARAHPAFAAAHPDRQPDADR